MNKIIVLFCFFIFLKLIFVQSQITPKGEPTTLTVVGIPDESYVFNYYQSWTTCQKEIFFVVINSDPLDTIDTVTSSASYAQILLTQGQYKLIRQDLSNVPLGSNLHNITVTSTLGVSVEYVLNITCLSYDINAMEIKPLGRKPSKNLNSYMSAFEVTGVPGTFHSIETTNTRDADASHTFSFNSYYMHWFENTINNNFDTNWTAIIDASSISRTFEISIENPFNDLSVEDVSEVTIHPTSAQVILEFGSSYVPLVTFVSSSLKNAPFLQFFENSYFGDQIPRPISGEPGSVKYISSFVDYFGDGSTTISSDIIFQNGTTTGKVPLNIVLQKLLPPPIALTITQQDDPVAPFFSIGFTTSNLFNSYSIIFTDFDLFLSEKKSFPFGFGPGNNNNFNYTVSLPKRLQSAVQSGHIVQVMTGAAPFNLETANGNVLPNEYVNDYRQPNITSFEFVQVFNSIHLLKLSVNDIHGIAFIFTVIGTSTAPTFAKLTSGDEYNGEYEIFIEIFDTVTIQVINNLGIEFQLINNTIINLDPIIRFKFPDYTNMDGINFSSFQNVSFLTNNLNLNNRYSYNIFYFNSSDIDIKKPMYLVLNDPISFYDRKLPKTSDFHPIVWNATLKMFNSKFVIPKNNIFGEIPYYVTTNGQTAYFSPDFDIPAPLLVDETHFDNYGPIITQVQKLPSDSYVVSITGKVGWRLTIEDDYNGFSRGYVKVMGSVDSSSYHFNFTLADVLPGGDRYKGDYDITFTMPTSCYTQQDYVMTIVQLHDRNDIISEFNVFGHYPDPTANPFINFMDDTRINKITIACSTPINDPTPPELTSFAISSTSPIDVGLLDRSVTFTFVATDPESGIREDQLPIVYANSRKLQVAEGKTKIISKTATSISYECTIVLPVAFAFPGIISYSVYGFINNGGYYKGFSSIDLKTKGFPYYSDSLYSFGQPVITDTHTITSEGGSLIIYGKGLTNFGSLQVSYSDEGTGTFDHTLSTVTTVTSSFIIVEGIKNTPKPYTVKITPSTSTYQVSNPITVYPTLLDITYPKVPTELPTNEPQQCLGEPICGGEEKGYCNDGIGCVCYSPWIGSDCSSQVLPVPPPVTNIIAPTTEIPISPSTTTGGSGVPSVSDSKISYNSLISLVSLRELTFDSQEVKSFTFGDWDYEKIGENKNQYNTNITTSSAEGGALITTNITVVLEWFTDSTVIQFASTDLTMNPSTIKYTVNITEYAFSSNLNSLQLVMSALFEADNEDVCSVKEFGSTSTGDNSNYVKIQIEDHSLYGRFIKRAIVDSKTTTITNEFLDSSMGVVSSSSQSQSLIGITIPNYNTLVTVDPDFSVLLDLNPVSSDDENSVCQSPPSSGLTKAQLAGIIVGSVGFAAVAAIVTTYFVVQKKKLQKLTNRLSSRN